MSELSGQRQICLRPTRKRKLAEVHPSCTQGENGALPCGRNKGIQAGGRMIWVMLGEKPLQRKNLVRSGGVLLRIPRTKRPGRSHGGGGEMLGHACSGGGGRTKNKPGWTGIPMPLRPGRGLTRKTSISADEREGGGGRESGPADLQHNCSMERLTRVHGLPSHHFPGSERLVGGRGLGNRYQTSGTRRRHHG